MKIIQFIYNNDILAQQSADMFLNQIDEVKWLLAETYKCYPDDIETRIVTLESNKLSFFDVSTKGITPFNTTFPIYVSGVSMLIDENNDEFLDAVQGKNIDNFIEKYLVLSF